MRIRCTWDRRELVDLRFGTFLAPDLFPVYEMIAETVGQRLGVTTELVVETDYENCVSDVNEVCFVCSLPYIMFERSGHAPADPVAAPVLVGPRYNGRPIYFSDVIVARNSRITSFAELRGHSWAINEPLSHSGYGMTRYHLVELGETDGFFGEVVETGFHELSVQMVAERRVDASAIDSQVLAIQLRDVPGLSSRLRIVASLGPSTIQPVAISRRVEPQLRDAVTKVLLDLHKTPAGRDCLATGLVERFVPVGPSSYDDIRSMLAACETAGFMELK